MDWFKTCKLFYDLGFYDNDDLKVFVVAKKINAEQYKQIAKIDYVAEVKEAVEPKETVTPQA